MMDEEKTSAPEGVSDTYDASDKPFDFVEEGMNTALICESDPAVRSKIHEALAQERYHITESESAQDALKKMRFHVYQLVVANESFDTDTPDQNVIFDTLKALPMSIRRNMFVVMISPRFRTMDNMIAFSKSVNLIVNPSNLDNIGTIIQKGLTDNEAFYHVYKESLKNVR
jgi:DNA-binding NtrC family response regulator